MRLPTIVIALLFAGCIEPQSHDALVRLDGGTDGGGPWSVCDDARLYGAPGDPCVFGEACGVPNVGNVTPSHDVVCLGGHLLVMSRTGTLDAACVEPWHDGECVTYTTSCGTNNLGNGNRDCNVGDGHPSRSIAAPWSLEPGVDCTILRAAGPEMGDACTGDAICLGAWAGWPTTVIWCASGSLHVSVHANGE